MTTSNEINGLLRKVELSGSTCVSFDERLRKAIIYRAAVCDQLIATRREGQNLWIYQLPQMGPQPRVILPYPAEFPVIIKGAGIHEGFGVDLIASKLNDVNVWTKITRKGAGFLHMEPHYPEEGMALRQDADRYGVLPDRLYIAGGWDDACQELMRKRFLFTSTLRLGLRHLMAGKTEVLTAIPSDQARKFVQLTAHYWRRQLGQDFTFHTRTQWDVMEVRLLDFSGQAMVIGDQQEGSEWTTSETI